MFQVSACLSTTVEVANKEAAKVLDEASKSAVDVLQDTKDKIKQCDKMHEDAKSGMESWKKEIEGFQAELLEIAKRIEETKTSLHAKCIEKAKQGNICVKFDLNTVCILNKN